MEKTIISFNKDQDKDNGIIELQAVMLKPNDHKVIRKELKNFKADFVSLDGDYIRAIIKEADYSTVEKLEALGWTFS